MERLTSTVTPQGVVGIAPFVDVGLEALDPPGAVAVLHEVRDPGNAGTILRSADAAGAGGRRVRRQLGRRLQPQERPGIGRLDLPRARRPRRRRRRMRSRRCGSEGSRSWRWTCTARRISSRRRSPVSPAFVFGNEAHGLPTAILEVADRRVRVPHAGRAESLNLAAAATVCLFEWVRRGRAHGRDARGARRGRGARHPVAAHGDEGLRLRARQALVGHDGRAAGPDARPGSSTTPTGWTRSSASSWTRPG